MGEGQYWPKGICLQNTHVWKIPNEINFISEMPISLTVLFFFLLVIFFSGGFNLLISVSGKMLTEAKSGF